MIIDGRSFHYQYWVSVDRREGQRSLEEDNVNTCEYFNSKSPFRSFVGGGPFSSLLESLSPVTAAV